MGRDADPPGGGGGGEGGKGVDRGGAGSRVTLQSVYLRRRLKLGATLKH